MKLRVRKQGKKWSLAGTPTTAKKLLVNCNIFAPYFWRGQQQRQKPHRNRRTPYISLLEEGREVKYTRKKQQRNPQNHPYQSVHLPALLKEGNVDYTVDYTKTTKNHIKTTEHPIAMALYHAFAVVGGDQQRQKNCLILSPQPSVQTNDNQFINIYQFYHIF